MENDVEDEVPSGIEPEAAEKKVVHQIDQRLELVRVTAAEGGRAVASHVQAVLKRNEIEAVPETVIEGYAEKEEAEKEKNGENQ
jgi:hypothetical protein